MILTLSIGNLGVLLDDTRIILHAGQAKFKVQKSDRPGDYWEVPDLREYILIKHDLLLMLFPEGLVS